jgi:glycogen phosphorylase
LINNLNCNNEKCRVKDAILSNLKRHFGKTLEDATKNHLYKACAITVRDEIMERWTRSQDEVERQNPKQLYYLSVEFLMGKSLRNNLINLLKEDIYREAFKDLGVDIDEVAEIEPDAGLGNGGLGRLAACFLDSLATLSLPGNGCGIRYEYGLFKQKIIEGYQIEMPDPWLEDGHVWEVPRPEEQEEIRFGGKIVEYWEEDRLRIEHRDYHTVIAVPYDIPIVGYDSSLINTLRLWSARSPKHMDMSLFSRGDYIKATEEKQLAEVISKVLYPEDNHYEGKALRLKQHYFFVSATMQYIIKKHKQCCSLNTLPDKVAIHINDTHPALAIPECMRILMDIEGLDWDTSWSITTKMFAYTNHTIMGEALERWPVNLFKELLPRIYMIINEINERYCKTLFNFYPNQWQRISQMAIIAYDEVRMANLCLAACHSVNGVSQLHTDILKNRVFKDYYDISQEKFCNITNGVTHRRWLMLSNPKLSELISGAIGSEWVSNPQELKRLETYSDDSGFKDEFSKIKRENKEKLARYILEHNGVVVNPDSIFDVHIKRLHEYKRQLLNIFHIMYLYNRLLENPNEDIYPRTFIFGAKASPGYHRAKLIVKLINSVASKVNKDTSIRDKIKVVFLEDYRVSLAEKIIPAANVSEQISTAGKEASGTGNMKLMLNGALTVGTLDGANIEMKNLVGWENIFIFGLKARQVNKYYQYGGYNPRDIYDENYYLKTVLDQLTNGFLEPDSTRIFNDLYYSLLYGNGEVADNYFVIKDFDSYAHMQQHIDRLYRNPDKWNKKAIINVANAGYFSSDRSIRDYNERIWNLDRIEF